MIEICNLSKLDCKYAYDVRVDRTSVLGNPYRMLNESERNEVCDLYDEYFTDMVNKNVSDIELYQWYDIDYGVREKFMNELRRLYRIHKQYGKLRLFCWCYPKRCHAETIKKFLEQFINC